jgi:hypothetical protein
MPYPSGSPVKEPFVQVPFIDPSERERERERFHTEKSNKIQQCIKIYYSIYIYIYEAQHVSGDTPPIIRSLKLH